MDLIRCAWTGSDPLYIDYHDNEWGIPVYDDRMLFEKICLEGAQAGLSWITILKKREGYRMAFDNFEPEICAAYSDAYLDNLRADPRIVRNRLKINSVRTNARACLEVIKEYGSFSTYIWSFVDNKPIVNAWESVDEIPAMSAISERMSRDLKRRGFTFVGATICYAYMQSMGLVNDHVVNCFCYDRMYD